MASQIDPSVIADNIKVIKADLREQFEIAKEEITALQETSSLPHELAYNEVSFDSL